METHDFVKEIAAEVSKGLGFVPFVGAGFSAPSGVPLINELEGYLQRCLCIALRLDEKGAQESSDHRSWNPRTDQWPPLVDRNSLKDTGHWATLLLGKINHLRPIVENNKGSAKDATWLKMYSEGFGAMQDWRTSLLFLSRLEMQPRGKDPIDAAPRLASPQPEVIDACFREVLRGRYPTLGHRMLGALAGALRIDLVLTTNFDDLLERAFETARNPLEIFEVLLDGSLPRRTEVESHRTLIKLHGGRVALRADYSLDEAPEQHDRDQFLSYLMSAGGRNAYSKYRAEMVEVPSTQHPNAGYNFDKHLILLGFSGTDKRINLLVREALARLKPEFRVYWLYFSIADEIRLKECYSDKLNQVKLIQCTSSGFLLLELYQYLRNALPPLGSIFPSTSRLTLPPITPDAVKKRIGEIKGKEIFTSNLENLIWKDNSESHSKVIIVHARPNMFGLTSLCVDVFRRLETSSSIMEMWIDMNNVSSADNLYEVLLEAVYYKIGIEEWIPSTGEGTGKDNKSYARRAEEFARLLKSVNKRWVFFLNARERPGANTYEPKRDNVPDANRNGWLDTSLSPKVDTANLESFVELIQSLCSKMAYVDFPEPAPLTFVVVVTDTLGSGVTKAYTWAGVDHEIIPLDSSQSEPDSLAERVKNRCVSWANEELTEDRIRFLHALVLMQRPRFPAALWSAAFFNDTSPHSPSVDLIYQCENWLTDLESKQLIRKKPGGMIWMHSECRNRLRTHFKDNPDKGNIHINIAAWYEKAIDASDAPDAVFEAAYHFCKAAQTFLPEEVRRAVSLVKAATAKIRSESYLIQTHGYSRGSCRQLERLADIGLEMWKVENFDELELPITDDAYKAELRKAIVSLWLACVETMRAIAREVGEDGKAFYRQRQIVTLYQTTIRLSQPVGDAWYASWETCRNLNMESYKRQSDTPVLNRPVFERNWCGRMFEAHTRNELPICRADLWRWLRWTAMLHIASRAYPSAEIFLHGIYSGGVEGLGPLKNQAKEQYQKISFKDTREPIEFLRMIEKAAELQLLQFATGIRSKISSEKCRERLQFAEDLIRRGLALAANIRDKDHTAEARDTVQANWCETRLLIHLSMIHVRAGEVEFLPRFPRDPLGILSDAEAKLRVSNPQRTRADLALIDLHRAEVKLHAPELRGLTDLFGCLKRRSLPDFTVEPLSIILRKSGASAADAIRFLDRAEMVMRERRRNVWWTSWYFERKLKAIAYSVLASCSEPSCPIPFLGLEAAMRLTDTEADKLLKDAQRMIRVDVYRMATVVEAYSLCLIALVTRLVSDPNIPRLPLRIDLMLRNLSNAVEQVEYVQEQRETVEDIDKNIKKYVTEIGRDIKALLNNEDFSRHLNSARTSTESSSILKSSKRRSKSDHP